MDILKTIENLLLEKKAEEAHDLIIEHEANLESNDVYWNLRGYLYLEIRELELSKSCFEKALTINTYNADVHYNLAYLYELLNDLTNATIHYSYAYKYTDNEDIKNMLKDAFIDIPELNDIFKAITISSKKTFILLSNVKWGIVYQRHHHLARSLSKLGFDVHYIEPVTTTDLQVSELNIELLNTVSRGYKTIDDVKIYTTFEATFNGSVIGNNYASMISEVIESIPDSDELVILNYNINIVEFLNSIKRDKKLIYECVDDNTDLDYAFWSNEASLYNEQETMSISDYIVTTSTALYVKHSLLENRDNVALIRNAVNETDFESSDCDEPDDIKNIPRPRIIYTGALYNRIDIELLHDTILDNPDKSFIIIGFGDESLLRNSPKNLYFLGPKKHSELKDYLKHSDVGIIPFKESMSGVVCCDSIKHYEYLSSNLPVVTTMIPESAILKPYTYLVSDKKEFSNALGEALSLNISTDVIKSFLVKNSWVNRAANIALLSEKEHEYLIEKDFINQSRVNITNALSTYNRPIFKCMQESLDNISSIANTCNLSNESNNGYIKNLAIRYMVNNNSLEELQTILSRTKFGATLSIIKSLEKDDYSKYILALSLLHIFDYYGASKHLRSLSEAGKSKIINYSSTPKLIKDLVLDIKFNNNDTLENSKKYIVLIDIDGSCTEEFLKTLCPKKNSLVILSDNNFPNNGCLYKDGYAYKNISGLKNYTNKKDIKFIIPFDDNFVKSVRLLSEFDVSECFVAAYINNVINTVHIDSKILKSVKNQEYLHTLSVYRHNAADGNIDAILRSIPTDLKDSLKIRIIPTNKIYSLEESIKTPLLSSVTLSGFAVFGNYPKHTYNIELWHGGMGLKTCGLMDKKDKNSGGSLKCFENIDLVCLASHMNCVQFTSCFAIPENKYRITGLPRTDLLLQPNSRDNLSALLGIDISDKIVIFNMPTFHVNSQSNRVEGSSAAIDYFKIPNFNYKEFDEFLKENNMICISKVHHNEESIVQKTKDNYKPSNLFYISNLTLDNLNMNLYDVLGCGDILITDYSSVYGDFLFMNKPTVFCIPDIDDYRKERGLALEPFDFWAIGPKVFNQKELQNSLDMNILNLYQKDREKIASVFFDKIDKDASKRVWDVLKDVFEGIVNKK